MELIIKGTETGVIGTVYAMDSRDVKLRHWEFVQKVLKLIEEENAEAVRQG